jgi:hypothetical protein
MVRLPPRLPADVRAALGIDGRVLAFEKLVGGGWVVATRAGLHVLSDGQSLVRSWTDVDGARLDAETEQLTVTWVNGTPETVIALDHPGNRLVRTVHDRVQSSVVLAERVTLPRTGVVRVVLRRGERGDLFTQVIGDGRVDLADPEVATAVDTAEARLRESAGL